MSYLRMTNWIDAEQWPMTMVVEAGSLKSEDPYDAVESFMEEGFFMTYEIFDAPSFEAAMLEGAMQVDREMRREHDMAIAYFYYIDAIRLVTEGGQMIGTQPAPLSREDMAWVLRNLSRHPNYRSQTVSVPLEDGTTIKMKNGEVLPA